MQKLPRNYKTQRRVAEVINNATYSDYLDRLKMVAVSLFTWKNLDKTFGFGASRFLENSLFEFGKACIVNDSELGPLVTNVTVNGKLNTYNLPTSVEAWSITYNKKYPLEEVVYIMNNDIELPTFRTIELVAYRLYEIQRTIDTNVKSMKTPILIETDSKSRLTLEQIYNQYDGNVPFIFGRKDSNLTQSINVLKTDAPYLADKLTLLKHEVFNELLTFLGINNANTDKKERLITDEAKSNDQLVAYYFNCFYKTRQKACDEINERFNLTGDDKISIELSQEALQILGMAEEKIFDDQETEEEVING